MHGVISKAASPKAATCPEGISSPSGFDEQFFQPKLYQHDDGDEAEHLLPYRTIVESNVQEFWLPGLLSFVQSDWFLMSSAIVSTANMVVYYLRVTIPDMGSAKANGLRIADHVFLAYYCVELLLRLAHLKKWFFWHRVDAKWNFVDALTVIAGVADQWVMPIVMARMHPVTDTWMLVARVVRLLVLLRLVKLLGVFARSDFRWTTSVWYDTLVSIVICSSILIMGLETDIKSPLWEPVENIILSFFVFEISVRLKRQGAQFFLSEGCLWNVLDMLIVVFGVLDQWILTIWMVVVTGHAHSSELGDLLLLIRMLRLLRILRLLRLVKAVRPLYLLALGIMEAMQSMFWVLVLTMVSLYTVGILMTRIVGHGAVVEHPDDIPDAARGLFSTVPNSMFTLFVIMNGEEWRRVEPLLAQYWGMKAVFVAFTIFSSWALLSVMTGVVSDNMISAKKSQNQKDDAMTGERRMRIERVLHEFVMVADASGTQRLTKERYAMMLDIPFYVRKLQEAAPNCSPKDLRDLFVWLDADSKTGEVGPEEFVRGFHTLSEPLTGKALLHVDAEVKRRCGGLREQVGTIAKSVTEERNRETEQHQRLMAMLQESE